MAIAGFANLEIVLAEFLGALGWRDRDAVRAILTPDVVWQGLREEWCCHGRAQRSPRRHRRRTP